MKVRCNACGIAEAQVLCCADEAVLRVACDKKVHSANKVAVKHHRVSLHDPSNSSRPRCDTCCERKGYLFCVEDRKFTCKQCDIATHAANSSAASHQRYLITGVQVALQSLATATDSKASNEVCQEGWPNLDTDSSFSHQPQVNEMMDEVTMDFAASSSEQCTAAEPEWPSENILGSNVFHYYDFSDDMR